MTLLDRPTLPINAPPQRKTWTGEEYDRLVVLGAFDGMRLELIDGEVFEMSPMGENHGFVTLRTLYILMRLFPLPKYTVKPQIPFKLNPKSRPEPDLAIYAGDLSETKSFEHLPLLAVEVSDSSLDYDRRIKLPAYASRQISEVWIINLPASSVEIHRNPHEVAGGQWAYDPALIFKGDETFATLIDPAALISARDLLA